VSGVAGDALVRPVAPYPTARDQLTMWQSERGIGGSMVKLICFLKRRSGMSVEEFHRYWRERHGPLVASTKSGSHVIRYEQNHRCASDYRRDDDGFDGVTEQWYASMEDFYKSVQEPDYAEIEADLAKFLDTDRLIFVMTEEPEVVIDGAVP
jgi:uncharacterized protein (TIGR02118 family)